MNQTTKPETPLLPGPARLVALLAAVLAVAGSGCAPVDPGADPRDPEPRLPIDGDAGTDCAHPTRGCSCDAEQPPIDCYLDPIVDGDQLTCRRGTRYCRDEVWTGCESIHDYQLRSGPGIAPLVTGPSECNPCDPSCAVSRDVPGSADLPGRSTNVEYRPSEGGIGLVTDMTGTGMLPDGDGDGIPDVADDCVGAGAYRDPATGTCDASDTFLFHDLPYGGTAEIDAIDINVQVRTADVYFLMDTTGSMGGEINNLRTGLTSGNFIPGCSGGIIGAIRCTIPDAWFGVGRYDDYPYGGYGGGGDVVYQNLQDISGTISSSQTAVNTLSAYGGSDGPESQSQALWATATGGGLGPYLTARSGCAAGSWGYPCFRPGTIPIVIHFTDAPIHNGPYGYDYSFGGASASLPTTTFVSGNETQGSARVIGDAATTWTGWTGNTCSHVNDYTASCASNSSGDVVFRFTVSTRRTITMSLEGSSYDTLLSLRNSGFAEIACNDDSVGLQSRLDVTLDPGTYFLVVEGWSTSCGTYRLSVGYPVSAGGGATGYPVSWADAVTALNDNGVRVITVHSGGSYGLEDANALADATGSYSSSGARYVFPIPSDGSGLSDAVVDAVVDLANYNRMDISARATDDPSTAGVDERGFVDSITANGWGPGSCSSISGGSVFIQCLPGTSVDFSVSFRNDLVMPTAVPQVFNFFIEVVGDGTFVLQRIPVRIVVPPDVPLYPPSGTYWRDYDSTLYCAENERPDWTDLRWNIVDLPAGTSVRWELRAAETLAALGGTTPVTFTTPSTTSPVDVGARLLAAGVPSNRPYLRITAVLLASPDRTQTPVLSSFELQYSCFPVE